MPSNSGIGPYMKIHGYYLVLQYAETYGFIVVNWRDKVYFRIEGKVGTKMFHIYSRDKTSFDIQYLYRKYIVMWIPR